MHQFDIETHHDENINAYHMIDSFKCEQEDVIISVISYNMYESIVHPVRQNDLTVQAVSESPIAFVLTIKRHLLQNKLVNF